MKWITREHRVISAAKEIGATPYDIPGVELTHVGERCSFDAFMDKYSLDDPALTRLATIVRGADASRRDSQLATHQLSTGFVNFN
jgi:hypothetical protein